MYTCLYLCSVFVNCICLVAMLVDYNHVGVVLFILVNYNHELVVLFNIHPLFEWLY